MILVSVGRNCSTTAHAMENSNAFEARSTSYDFDRQYFSVNPKGTRATVMLFFKKNMTSPLDHGRDFHGGVAHPVLRVYFTAVNLHDARVVHEHVVIE